MTLEEYAKAQIEKRAAFNAQFSKGSKERAVDSELSKLTAVVRIDDPESEVFILLKGSDDKSKGKAKEKKDGQKVTLETGFSHKEEAKFGERERGGRERGRGGRGRGEGRRNVGSGRGGGRGYTGPTPNLTDASAFPTLGK